MSDLREQRRLAGLPELIEEVSVGIDPSEQKKVKAILGDAFDKIIKLVDPKGLETKAQHGFVAYIRTLIDYYMGGLFEQRRLGEKLEPYDVGVGKLSKNDVLKFIQHLERDIADVTKAVQADDEDKTRTELVGLSGTLATLLRWIGYMESADRASNLFVGVKTPPFFWKAEDKKGKP